MVKRRADSVPPRLGVFVGRDRELAELYSSLATGERRITLTGEPGIGKSRLAARLAESWPQAAWVVDLSDASGAAEACHAVAQALGVAAEQGPSAIARRLERLSEALVVLDGCDHAAEGLRTQLGEWLRRSSAVAFVATCRTPLGDAGEVVIEIGALSLPPESDELEGDAARLMTVLMRRAGVGGEHDDAERRTLARVIRMLNGNPLALELAAARLPALSPDELLARLSKRLEHPDHGAPTVHHAIDLSWEMLASHERSALTQCAVFRGGFTIEAAEAVIELSSDAPPILEVMQRLRIRSLVTSGRPVAGVRRLYVSRSIRDYATERAAAEGLAQGATNRHAAYFASWAWAKRQLIDGVEGASSRARLWAEQQNLLAAVERQLADPQLGPDTLLEALLALDVVLATHGPMSTRLNLLGRAIELVRTSSTEPARELLARALQARAHAARRSGRSDQAIDDVEEALSLARALGNKRLEARLLTERGVQHSMSEERDLAVQTLSDALQLALSEHDLAAESSARVQLAKALLERGDADEALEQAHAAENAAGALGDARAYGIASHCRGLVHQDQGELDAAERAHHEAIQVLELLGERAHLTACLCQLGITLEERGQLDEAAELLERAHQEGTLDRWTDVLMLAHAAAIDAARGRLEAAEGGLAAADALMAQSDVPHLADAVRLIRSVVDLARAGELGRRGRDAEPLRRSVVERLRELGGGTERLPSIDLRVGLRIVERRLGESLAVDAGSKADDDLLVQSDGLWFRVPGGAMVSCKRRKEPTRRLLAHLATQRLTAPGEPTDAAQLIAIGWPGERMNLEAALGRLNVTINGLRRAGLSDVLLTDSDGYWLDPSVSMRVVSAQLPSRT